MLSLFFALFFTGFMLLCISLQRSYSQYTLKELKRRARAGEPLEVLLYKAASYGVSLQVLLWGFITLSAAVSFVFFSHTFAGWFSSILIAFFLWLGFLWLPHARLTKFSHELVRLAGPAVAWLVQILHPVLRRIGAFVYRHRHVSVRTQLYEKEDVVELLGRQSEQPDNRIRRGDIALAVGALTFSDKTVAEVLVPRRVVKVVAANEAIGPKLMDELYKSGYSRFPVKTAEESDEIIGTLYMKDLVKRAAGGHVQDVFRPDVYYIHEDFTLQQALHAFLKTKHHLFIVVNSFEEFIGIVTIEDILEALIGKQIVDEFDAYDDMRAVAAQTAQASHREHVRAKQAVPMLSAEE